MIVGVAGAALTVTTTDADEGDVQPPEVAVTVYVPEVVTVIACVVALLDHVFPELADEVKTTDPPAQKVVGPPAEIVGVLGIGLTVTVVAVDVAVQPDALETVTVYEPEVVTLIVCVVAPPGDHK